MALTQIKSGAIADDAIDSSTYIDGSIDNAHLAANSVDSDQYVDGSIDNAHLADDAVDGDKLANSINTEIAANTAKVTNATHTGDVTGSGALTIAANSVDGHKLTDNIDIAGTLDVTGSAVFDSAATFDSTVIASGKITANAAAGLQTKYLTVARTGDTGESIDAPNNIIELYCQSDNGTNRGLKIGSVSATTGQWGNQWVYDAIHPSGAHYFNIEEKMRFAVFKNRSAFYSGTLNDDVASIDDSGNATFDGALSKGSGSFKISHPLPEKTETHHLVHSFIEGPQADLIYSGMVTLVAGKAEINLDTAARMTEGTFLLLNTNLRRFVSNEGGWTAVKSSITGNVLTVEAQDNACTDEVFWTVIGERKDQHMIDTSWTDENGRAITEPLKETKVAALEAA
jgi:hypothetical protein